MARSRPPENVTARPPAAEKPAEPPRGLSPGWTIALTVWAVLFGVLVLYEAWGFFGGLLRR